MGTRNLIAVIYENEVKVAQYGQWDGYLEGQGKGIVEFLENDFEIEKFKQKLKRCKFLTKEELEKIYKQWEDKDGYITDFNARMLFQDYPQLSRDMGSEVLEFIYRNPSKMIPLCNQFEFGFSPWCEFAYVINIDNEIVEVYYGYNHDELDPNERFYTEEPTLIGYDGTKYYGCKLKYKIPIQEFTNEKIDEIIEQEQKEDD